MTPTGIVISLEFYIIENLSHHGTKSWQERVDDFLSFDGAQSLMVVVWLVSGKTSLANVKHILLKSVLIKEHSLQFITVFHGDKLASNFISIKYNFSLYKWMSVYGTSTVNSFTQSNLLSWHSKFIGASLQTLLAIPNRNTHAILKKK